MLYLYLHSISCLIIKKYQMENLEIRLDFVLTELNYFLDLRTKLLRKNNLNKKDVVVLNALNKFTENLPLSLDSDINSGFQEIKEFAKKISEKH